MAEVAWIASYPKSGNTWLRFMLTRYLTGKMPAAGENVVPDLSDVIRRGETLNLDGEGSLMVKTHFLPSKGQMQLYRSTTTKSVSLVRNPRDVLLSALRHYNITEVSDAQEFAKNFIANEGAPMFRDVGMGTWAEHVRDWTDQEVARKYLPDVDILTVRYEDMRKDTTTKLKEIVEFLDLGREVVDDEIAKTVEDTSIEKMGQMNIFHVGPSLPQMMRKKSPGGPPGAGPGGPQRMMMGPGGGPAGPGGGQGGPQRVMMGPGGGPAGPGGGPGGPGGPGQPGGGTPRFGVPGKMVGEGKSNQSLSHISDETEEAYRALLSGSSLFAEYAAKFGYAD